MTTITLTADQAEKVSNLCSLRRMALLDRAKTGTDDLLVRQGLITAIEALDVVILSLDELTDCGGEWHVLCGKTVRDIVGVAIFGRGPSELADVSRQLERPT